MAEGLFNARARESGWKAESAGIAATPGQPPSEHAITVMDELHIDIRSQRSQLLTLELAESADAIVVMTYGHLDAILLRFPSVSEKVTLLRQYVEGIDPTNPLDLDLSDPIGQSIDVYRLCRDQIQEAIPGLIKTLQG